MTVPPNYSVPPEYPPPPPGGGGFGYGGRPPQPEGPKNRNWLIGGIVIGTTAVLLGSILLVTLLVNRGGEEDPVAGGETEEASADEESAEEETSAAEEETTEAESDSEIGLCLSYDPDIVGDGLETVDCSDSTAFWEITNQSYEVSGSVDSEGELTDLQVAYDLCGEEYGASPVGEAWTNWQYVYSSGAIDSMYCMKAIGNPDPENPERTPYTPTDGDCFDDSDKWWTVECDSSLAVYEVVGHVDLDEPREMTTEEAGEEATCGGGWYWQVTDTAGRTTSIICGDEL
ncbi:hypothetical protein GCM10029992_15860 [Glycomyces albus]